MRLIIKGKNKFLPSAEQRRLVKWLAKELLGDLAKDIRITLWNVSIPDPTDPLTDGLIFSDKEYEQDKVPRHFKIVMRNGASKYRQGRILAHEMGHVKQLRSGEWEMGYSRWRSRMVSPRVSYDNQPWEKDACRAESLYKKFQRCRAESLYKKFQRSHD